jgi:formimidoylglutamate deiminase
MGIIHAATALLPEGWRRNVRIEFLDGTFSSIQCDVPALNMDERHAVVLPGMPNLHSHAFQRGMAGLTETRGRSTDNFWSWRDVMYRFALGMTPEQTEAVAAQLYMEMLEAGFNRVGEFHYLHHAPDGSHYANPAEMAVRIASAAEQTGIRLTLLPVFYAHSDFGGATPTAGQRRFINDIDGFARLFEGCKTAIQSLPGSTLGLAPHSLRAVTWDELKAIIPLTADGPIHMHVAEQMVEVKACLAWSGVRPVQWLLDHVDVDERWCLIHATHMTQDETQRLANSGAVAGLCPITEANLGDGTFPGKAFLDVGGTFGIGSDSNVLIGIGDELRQLEYSQRLLHQARNLLSREDQSTGRTLFESALHGGRRALQALETGLHMGAPADFIALDQGDGGHLVDDAILDGWIFAQAAQVDCVWIGGHKRVVDGRHIDRARISQRFATVMQAMAGEGHGRSMTC